MHVAFPAGRQFTLTQCGGRLTTRGHAAAVLLGLLVACLLISELPRQSGQPSTSPVSSPETTALSARPRVLTLTPVMGRESVRQTIGNTAAFVALQNLWETVWSIDAVAAELNEANIMDALALRERAERGDLDATVLLLGAAGWCASAGPLALQHEGARGAPAACLSRFGSDIDSRESLDWAIFRWTMQLANAGLTDATLYASVLGREQLFATLSSSVTTNADATETTDTADRLRAQLIGQLQSMVEAGSPDAASELNSYYLNAIAHGHTKGMREAEIAPVSALARYYAALTERLDPTRTGMVELTEEWILEHS